LDLFQCQLRHFVAVAGDEVQAAEPP